MTGTTSDVGSPTPGQGRRGATPRPRTCGALHNATGRARDSRVGRKGLDPAIFRGYTAGRGARGDVVDARRRINDFGIAGMARWLLDQTSARRLRPRAAERRAALVQRPGRRLRAVFRPDRGFFLGRRADGAWRVEGRLRPGRVGRGLHRDQRLGHGRSRCRTTAPGSPGCTGERGARRRSTRSSPTPRPGGADGLLRARHPRDDRGSRRPDGDARALQPARAPHPVQWLHAGRPDRTQAVVREIMRRFHRAPRSARATRGTRTTGRCRRGSSSPSSGSTRPRSAAPSTRCRRRCTEGSGCGAMTG